MYRALTSFVMNKEIYAEEDIKKGQILPSDFVSSNVINDLLNSNYIEVYDSSLDITENGTYDVTDYEQANVNVSSTPILQSKEITITENGSTNITPDIGYDGLGRVDVITNVSSGGDYNVIVDTSGHYNTNNGIKSLIKEISLIDTSNLTSMQNMFSSCENLTEIPLLNTSNATNMASMFTSCSKLTSIPLIDTSKVTNMSYMCAYCTNLTTIPLLNTSNVTNLHGLITNNTKLTTETLNNILKMCINATNYTGTKTLVYVGLASNYTVDKIQALPDYQNFINAGWTIGR